MANQDTTISTNVTDKDIIFKGVDGGTPFTALTLDMSAAGAATFNSTVKAERLIITDYAAAALKIIPDPAFSTEPEHDLIYTGYQSNFQDYISIKAAGNSSTFHGALAITDVGTYFGRTHVETGSPVGNTANSPFNAGNFGYFNSTGLTVNGTITSGAITSSGAVTTTSSNGFVINDIGRMKMNSNNLYIETETNGTGIVLNSRTGFVTFQNNGATAFQINSSNNATFQGLSLIHI